MYIMPRYGLTAFECCEIYGYEYTGDPNAVVCDHVIDLMATTPRIEQRTPEWYAQRERVITASAVPTAIEWNKYQTREDLLFEKVFGSTFAGNEATEHGTKHEPIAIQKFCDRTGETVFEFGLVPHPRYQYLAASPDGVCASGAIIEVKCPLRRAITHECPRHYQPQVQIVHETLDSNGTGYFIQYRPAEMCEDGREILDILEVPRDRAWFAQHLPVIRDFWKDVLFYRAHPYELCRIDEAMYP